MAVNITTDTNTVKVTSTSTNNVKIVDNKNNTSVTVSQPTTRVIKVATVGPQGPAGAGASIDTGSFAITGSNTFYGLQTVSASSISPSALDIHAVDHTLWAFRVYNDLYSSTQPGLGSWIDNTGEANIGTEVNKPLYIYTNANYGNPTLIISSSGVTVTNNLTVTGNQVITGSLTVSGSSTFTGNQIVTGSTRGNVTALSIATNTASIDLSLGNFYTLQLVSGSNTYINPSNILPGQTSILTLSTTGSATVSWPSSVKQPSGSAYVPTTTAGIDIITLASVDSLTLYVVSIKNMI